MKKCLLILLTLILFIPGSLLSQRIKFDIPLNEYESWTKSGVIHCFPDGFSDMGQCGWAYGTALLRRDRSMPWKPNPNALLGSTILQSNDKQCELYYPIFLDNGLPNQTDSLSYSQSSWGYYPQYNLIHRSIMIRYIPEFRGQDDFKFEDYVTAIGGEMPREYFNADSVFFWNFPIEPTEQDAETYTECTFMFVWNKERWIGLTFAWFFTDEGKKNKWQYIEKLKKCVWYKDMTTN